MLNQDFKEFIESLNANCVRYLVVGGYAVAFHGHPRYTKDLDVWVELSADNARNILAALNDFGFGSLGLKETDFMTPDQFVQLGYPPNRIDITPSIEGVDFDECYAAKEEVVLAGVKVNFIDLENLKKNKKAAGRLQDLADLEKLK
jgi:predicted nucleotidyltransferase